MPLILMGGFGTPPINSSGTAEVDHVNDSVTLAGGYWGTADPLYWLEDPAYSTAIRFHGLLIPEGATVTLAELRVARAGGTWAATSNDKVLVGVEQTANPSRLSSSSDHGTRKSNIGSTIDWAIGTGDANSISTSPNLASIVQPVVNLSGFSGSIMFFTHTGPSVDHTTIQVHSYYTGSSGTYPTLYLEWTV